ncbi:MAG: 5-(carboxyamino)imidazole ribonucleotide mutase [Bacteroidales bacterium]|nr:5-(carboxyamino)imidazole ribonucleotide mutase [Bacteroidales bacterium]
MLKVSVIMGSTSDLDVMSAAFDTLEQFGVEYEKRVISAHRAPDLLAEFAKGAEGRGVGAIIAGAGGAAHLAGVTAAFTTLPVIGVPINGKAFGGMDALLATVQMPSGIPVATVAVNGAKNAALLAIEMLALGEPALAAKLKDFRREQTEKIKNTTI